MSLVQEKEESAALSGVFPASKSQGLFENSVRHGQLVSLWDMLQVFITSLNQTPRHIGAIEALIDQSNTIRNDNDYISVEDKKRSSVPLGILWKIYLKKLYGKRAAK